MPDSTPSPLTPEELRELVELEKKATHGPWVDLTERFAKDYEAHHKRTGSWWHGSRRAGIPFTLIARADVHGRSVDELRIPEDCDWHDLKRVFGLRLSDMPKSKSLFTDGWIAKEDRALLVALRNAAPRIFSELLALREENARLSEEVIARAAQVEELKRQLALTLVVKRASSGTKPMPPRPPPPAPPRPVRAVAGTSLVCTACGCRWKKHPPDDVFPQGSLQLYDADQRPCVECCDNTSNPPLRHETLDDSKGDPA